MFSTGLIVFRETLEAALFIGIIAAATRHIPQRNQSIVIGILLGIAGAIALALGIGVINDMADGTGQDWLHILILCTAFLMLLWHVLYASEHGRELAQKARTMGTQVHLGKTSLMAITIAIALMVLRERNRNRLIRQRITQRSPATLRHHRSPSHKHTRTRSDPIDRHIRPHSCQPALTTQQPRACIHTGFDPVEHPPSTRQNQQRGNPNAFAKCTPNSKRNPKTNPKNNTRNNAPTLNHRPAQYAKRYSCIRASVRRPCNGPPTHRHYHGWRRRFSTRHPRRRHPVFWSSTYPLGSHVQHHQRAHHSHCRRHGWTHRQTTQPTRTHSRQRSSHLGQLRSAPRRTPHRSIFERPHWL